MVILVRAPRIQPTYLRVAQSWEILEQPRALPCSGGHAHNPHAQVAVFFCMPTRMIALWTPEPTAASCAAPAPLRRIPATPAAPAALPASPACTGRVDESVSGDYRVILRA